MSSRFFKPQYDSESESEESENEIQPQRPAVPAAVSYGLSDEEEETKRVVRTEKEKRYEELKSIMKLIKNHTKIKDISKLLTSFENLSKAFAKAKPVIEKEENGITPRFYVKCLVEMEDFVADMWEDREGRKNMSKNNSKSLATLRQKLRKYNKDFESEILLYRESPDPDKDDDEESGSDEESNDSDGSEAGFLHKGLKKEDKADEGRGDDDGGKDDKSKFLKGAGSDDDKESDDSYWGSSSDESSSESDFEGGLEGAAARFLKKEPADGDKTKKREKKTKEEKRTAAAKKKAALHEDADDDDGDWEKVKGGTVSEKPKMFSKDEEINHESVVKKLSEILAMRGKKRIHRTDQIEMLIELLGLSDLHKLGPALKTKIIMGILAALMDYNTISPCMKTEMWSKCVDFCTRLVETLIANQDIAVGENITEESESFVSPPYRVHGCALTLVERMDEEFTKMLQAVDAHSPDYIDRLKDEKKVDYVIEKLQEYLETNQRGTSSELCRVYILRIDHLYYKFDPEVFKQKVIRNKQREAELKENGFRQVNVVIADEPAEYGAVEKPEGEEADEIKKTSLDIMDRLCKYIYAKDVTDRIRTQAILCHIYHHALHDNWFEARDLMLMSQLQHNINKSDIPLQIIYNRALVQLGLCAFRQGNIRDAHAGLLDIQILGRAKELLAQGLLPKQQERSPEQEKLEKRRLLPFHKHINLELLECVYLVSAMLLEIPDVAANEYSVRKKMISRSFYNQLRKNEEQPLVGLPESMREHVVAASKAMRVGNWKACRDFIINDKMNAKVWNLFHQPDKVREMLVQKIREESLRAYLFTYSHIYDSISLQILSQMFDLEHGTVHSIISKMIINEELMASLDEPTQILVMHRTEPSRIQGLALQLADKVNTLVEHNERIWESKQINVFMPNRQGGNRDNQNYRDHQRQDRNYLDRNTRDQRRTSNFRT